jgi:nicotinate-nucleotide--dimethylbenzimidazole phosphoribosyltransferase
LDLSERFSTAVKPAGNARIKRLLTQKINSKTKPSGALGFLEDIALQAGMVFNSISPKLKKPTLLVFAADHGIADQGITTYTKDLTHQLVLNFLHEGAAINVFANAANMSVKLIDVGVDHSFEGTMTYWLNHGTKVQSRKIGMGTRNLLEFPAMATADAERSITTGQKLVAHEHKYGCNTIGFGDIAVGNNLSGMALSAALLELSPDKLLGIGEESLLQYDKALFTALDKILRKHPKTHDPVTLLALYGGYEIGAMIGAIIEASKLKMLVLIDGFIATVALLVAQKLAPNVIDYCIVCQSTGDYTHQLLLKQLNKRPVLNLGVTLGEGCGVPLALPIIQNALHFLSDMSTFEELRGNSSTSL